MVAEDGWKLLPQYLFNLESGEWLHHSNPALTDRKSLQKVSYASGQFTFTHEENDNKAPFNLYDTLLKAKEIIRLVYIIVSKPLKIHKNFLASKKEYLI